MILTLLSLMRHRMREPRTRGDDPREYGKNLKEGR